MGYVLVRGSVAIHGYRFLQQITPATAYEGRMFPAGLVAASYKNHPAPIYFIVIGIETTIHYGRPGQPQARELPGRRQCHEYAARYHLDGYIPTGIGIYSCPTNILASSTESIFPQKTVFPVPSSKARA